MADDDGDPLAGVLVCSSGIVSPEKEWIEREVVALGADFSRDFHGDVSVLVANKVDTDKCRAAFKLKVSALSSLRQQQRFRISIRVAGGKDMGLQVLTQAFRTLTKLYRAPARPSAAPTASQSEPARPFTPDLLDDAERPIKRQPTEAEMQRLRGECARRRAARTRARGRSGRARNGRPGARPREGTGAAAPGAQRQAGEAQCGGWRWARAGGAGG